MRGEYEYLRYDFFPDSELPPRARRILVHRENRIICAGTTSACAENTPAIYFTPSMYRNYLRVRGEYYEANLSETTTVELPPRARRIRLVNNNHANDFGTTSACAENTSKRPGRCGTQGNYLRVRGEYVKGIAHKLALAELPPRARRIQPLT